MNETRGASFLKSPLHNSYLASNRPGAQIILREAGTASGFSDWPEGEKILFFASLSGGNPNRCLFIQNKDKNNTIFS